MRALLVAILAATACSHTYNDRGLAQPPRHPFNFPPPPPPSEPASGSGTIPHTQAGRPTIDVPDPAAPPQ